MDDPKGIISINRVYGRCPCYGTPVENRQYVEIVISQAVEINGNIGPSYQLVSLRLAMHQYIELLSSLNAGNGTPCTLQYVKGPCLPYEPDSSNDLDNLKKEVERELQELNTRLLYFHGQVKVLRDKGKANKKELSNLCNLAEETNTILSKNTPYILTRALKLAHKHISNAKSEFLAYVGRLTP